MRAIDQMMKTGLRERRAQALTAFVMNVIEPYLDQNPDHDTRRCVSRELHRIFSAVGVEVITDFDRAQYGLPQRDSDGVTERELAAMEAARAAAVLGPIPPIVRDIR